MSDVGDHLMRDHPDSRAVLWANLQAIMLKEFGRENLSRLSNKTGVPLASLSRIKGQTTSVGLAIIDKLAAALNLSGWQLLVPGFDPKSPPTLRAITEHERAMYERLMTAARELASEPIPKYRVDKP